MTQNDKALGPPEFTRLVKLDDVGGRQTDWVLAPTEAERAAMCERLDLLEIKGLEGRIKLTPWGAGVRADVILAASVRQSCGVSLEPVDEQVNERFDVPFLPAELMPDETDDGGLEEDKDEDPPEPILDGVIDLGELVTQLLAVSLNPYPRKNEVSLEEVIEAEGHKGVTAGRATDEEQHRREKGPFSSLQSLKNRLS